MIKEIKQFTIDRRNWGMRALLNKNGTMCCLGHLAKACGLPDASLRTDDGDSLALPRSHFADAGYPAKFARNNFDVQHLAAEINDNDNMSRPEKEQRITTLFKAHGIKVKFVGKFRKGLRTV